MKIPKQWQEAVDAGTPLGERVKKAMERFLPDYRAPVKRKTGYGDRLAAIIERETGEQTTCSGCQNEIAVLNWMPREEVLANANDLAERIRSRASARARAWWQRWGCSLAPDFVRSTIRSWILEAISDRDNLCDSLGNPLGAVFERRSV